MRTAHTEGGGSLRFLYFTVLGSGEESRHSLS